MSPLFFIPAFAGTPPCRVRQSFEPAFAERSAPIDPPWLKPIASLP